MAMKNVLEMIEKNDVKFVDLRFTDTRGKEQHISIPSQIVDEHFFKTGKMFDGSSIAGWKTINSSDMVLMPDAQTAVMDPFTGLPTLILRCDVIEPTTQKPYDRDPRAVAKRAEQYLIQSGIADKCNVGPEPEFFIFDDVRWKIDMSGAMCFIDSEEAPWNSDKIFESGNIGHRPAVKGGYFPVPPVDSSHDLRSEMCATLEKMGLIIEAHHHEVATCNQNEISTRYNSLLFKADDMQKYKYVIHNVAHQYGKTATFMAKPLVGDNGSGMHCHMSLEKNGHNLFMGNGYAGLSDTALYFIGGIIKHARALNAFTNPTTNSYKRLVPGFEAPVLLAYGARNRSAAIRIPESPEKGRRIEIRFPDAMVNPYLAFSAMLMAGLDGVQNRIHPGDPIDEDLYELHPEQAKAIPTVCHSLDLALECLEKDYEFLLAGGVFNKDLINAYAELKFSEVTRLRMTTHPVEFDMYYSL